MVNNMVEPEVVYDKDGNAHEVVDFNNDYEGAKLGFWIFLLTEAMIFGSLFIVYGFYFTQYAHDFVEASHHMDRLLGGINTFVLLISTLTMGLSVISLKNNDVKKSQNYVWLTTILAIIFLVIKYNEWMLEISGGFYPNSPDLDTLGNGIKLFFGLYFSLTGLHGLHIIVGIGVMLWLINKIKKGEISSSNFVVLENTALYWDFVHIVWIIVFPIFYLIY